MHCVVHHQISNKNWLTPNTELSRESPSSYFSVFPVKLTGRKSLDQFSNFSVAASFNYSLLDTGLLFMRPSKSLDKNKELDTLKLLHGKRLIKAIKCTCLLLNTDNPIIPHARFPSISMLSTGILTIHIIILALYLQVRYSIQQQRR